MNTLDDLEQLEDILRRKKRFLEDLKRETKRIEELKEICDTVLGDNYIEIDAVEKEINSLNNRRPLKGKIPSSDEVINTYLHPDQEYKSVLTLFGEERGMNRHIEEQRITTFASYGGPKLEDEADENNEYAARVSEEIAGISIHMADILRNATSEQQATKSSRETNGEMTLVKTAKRI